MLSRDKARFYTVNIREKRRESPTSKAPRRVACVVNARYLSILVCVCPLRVCAASGCAPRVYNTLVCDTVFAQFSRYALRGASNGRTEKIYGGNDCYKISRHDVGPYWNYNRNYSVCVCVVTSDQSVACIMCIRITQDYNTRSNFGHTILVESNVANYGVDLRYNVFSPCTMSRV